MMKVSEKKIISGWLLAVLEVAALPIPPSQEVILKVLKKPPSVYRWQSPVFSPDGEWIAFSFTTKDNPKRFSIGRMREDGSDFEKLCCKKIEARRPIWFPDGKRLLFQRRSGLQNIFYVYDLQEKKVFPISGMVTAGVLEQNRWLDVSPDGNFLFWTKVRVDGFKMVMGRLKREEAKYVVEEVRILYPLLPEDPGQVNEAWKLSPLFAWYENKGFTDGGKTLVFAGTRDEGGNLDAYTMDLESGKIRRLTRHIEWDEGGSFSPDGRWFAFETTRAHAVLSCLSNLPIPPFLDFVLVFPITNVTLTGPWFAPHEAYLLDRKGDRGDYFGQRLTEAGDQGWAIRGGVHWHPGGKKVIWGALLGPEQSDSEIVIATFPHLKKGKPLPIFPMRAPAFAPLLKEVKPFPRTFHRVLQGRKGGSVELTFKGTLLKGDFTLRFDHFAEKEGEILNGTMQVRISGLGRAHLLTQLTMTGATKGEAKIDLKIQGKNIEGVCESRYGERHFEKRF